MAATRQMSGTSFAAPHVAAVAALEMAFGRTLSLTNSLVSFSGTPATPAASPTSQSEELPDVALTPPPRHGQPGVHLSSNLLELAEKWNVNQPQALQHGQTYTLEITDTQVAVTVTMSDVASATAAKSQVIALGGTVTAAYDRWFDAQVPIAALTQIASLPGTILVQPIVRVFPVDGESDPEPTANPEDDRSVSALVGSMLTQGVAASNANTWQAAGYTGAGVTVAVMDCGFSNVAGLQASGDLPSALRLLTLGTPPSCAHGSAVAEIVYDMAPGVDMILVAPQSGTEMAARIQELANFPPATRPKIITSSIGYDNLEPGDGTGPVSSAIAYAASQGVLFTQAAGNNANYNWQVSFTDADADDYLDFAPGNDLNSLVPEQVTAGSTIRLYLRWNNWPTTNQDYDLYLYRQLVGESTWSLVAWSQTDQNGTASAPVESISYYVSTSGYFAFSIQKHAATGTQMLDVMGYNIPSFQFNLTDHSLIDPASGTAPLFTRVGF